jgi:hypothetical protein
VQFNGEIPEGTEGSEAYSYISCSAREISVRRVKDRKPSDPQGNWSRIAVERGNGQRIEPAAAIMVTEMKRERKNVNRPAASNDQKVLARLFKKGDKRAGLAREWVSQVIPAGGQVVLEATAGGLLDGLLRSAAAKGRLGPAEAQELLKMAIAMQAPGKSGPPKKRSTLERIQGVAWLRAHEPGISQRKIATTMGIEYGEFRIFWRRNKIDIETATRLLEPSHL